MNDKLLTLHGVFSSSSFSSSCPSRHSCCFVAALSWHSYNTPSRKLD